ncbi:MAG: cation:proton antiporter regulatory subunit [Pseudomonadales bacterium]
MPEGSKYVGLAIRDTDLNERDINVLTLYRGAKIIPNPNTSRVLEPGDKILCYGKLEAMREMIPAKTRRRRRPRIKELEMKETVEEGLQSDQDETG